MGIGCLGGEENHGRAGSMWPCVAAVRVGKRATPWHTGQIAFMPSKLLRPCHMHLTAGVEEALSSMRAGGRRRVVVPAALGFGDAGAVLRPTEHVPEKQGVVPPGAELEYELTLERISIPPN